MICAWRSPSKHRFTVASLFAWLVVLNACLTTTVVGQTNGSDSAERTPQAENADEATPAQAAAELPPTGEVASETETGLPTLTVAEVQSAIDALEADSSIEDPVKAALRETLQQALAALESASLMSSKATQYGEAIQSGPERLNSLQAELKALETEGNQDPLRSIGTTEALQRELDSRRVSLELLRKQLADVTTESARAVARTVEIPERLSEVRQQLDDTRQQMQGPKFNSGDLGASAAAEKLLLRATEAQLASELAMLENEQLSQSIRQELLKAQQQLLTRQIAREETVIEAGNERLQALLSNLADRIRRLAASVSQEAVQQVAGGKTLIEDVKGLADQLDGVLTEAKQAERIAGEIRLERETLETDYANLQEQMDLGSGSALAQLLYDLDRQCREAQEDLEERTILGLEDPRLASLQINEKLREQSKLETQQESSSDPEPLTEIVAARREVLEELDRQYSSLLRSLAAAHAERQKYRRQLEDVRQYVAGELFGFGLKASPAAGWDTLRGMPTAIAWYLQPKHWQEISAAFLSTVKRTPIRSGFFASLFVLLILVRPKLVVAIEETGRKIRRISTDRYRYTFASILWTMLLAIPIPLLVGYIAWSFREVPRPSDWFAGLRAGVWLLTWVMLAACIASAVLRQNGLGALHFGWGESTLARFRSALARTIVLYAPALLITISCIYGDASPYLDSLGRFVFVAAHLWMAFQMFRVFSMLTRSKSDQANGETPRFSWGWRSLWIAVVLAAPVVLVGSMLYGYMISSIMLSLGLVVTLSLIGGGAVLHGLVLRWFVMRQRKLDLAERLELRRERQEAEEHESESEIVEVEPEDASEHDLRIVAEQIRDLLRSLITLGVLFTVIAYWAQSFPLIDLIDSVSLPLFGGLTLLRLAIAILVGVVTYIVVKNLPGVIELFFLRSTKTTPGTRLALVTLCQYGVTAVGAAVCLNAIEVDWSQFGWAVAALSVGLGFGLQEVVANFVCGLILLLERPIRVGDIVTVEAMTGTVTKIKMRATTITNWDRQEFIVPNRTLITNTLLNWTLSASLNRVVIPVGVAYGTDTNRAREILLAVAEDHPNVVEDPKPMATFEQFADSSLNMVLRVFLPDLDARLGTISDLHSEINRRFADAGIEIAFPQRDLHLRSGWPGSATTDASDVKAMPNQNQGK